MLTTEGDPALTKWYHLVWTTHRRKRTFKIPATARFCERAVIRACADAGCDADAVRVTPTQVHVLVRAPAAIPRRILAKRLKRTVERALRTPGGLGPAGRRLWDPGGWCGTVTNPRGVTALRCYLGSVAGPTEFGVYRTSQ